MPINCSFCEKEIVKDRYNIMLEIERQDFVPEGNWQKTGDLAKEDVCPNCFDTIILYFKHILDNLRHNKGIYKNSQEEK